VTWVRLADDFYRHPKVLSAGPLAGWLWVCGLAYANHYLTDGYLPRAAVRGLTDVDEPFRLAATLVDAGLWDVADGGFMIHDYTAYQPTAEHVKAERAANAERVATWRERQQSGRSNGVTSGVRTGAPVPGPGPVNPVPDPAVSSTPLPPPPQAEEGELAKPTKGDVKLWTSARERLRADMSPANWDQLVAPLEPLGRASDGGLWLRAPPGQSIGARVTNGVRKALLDAGDAAAKHVAIVEG